MCRATFATSCAMTSDNPDPLPPVPFLPPRPFSSFASTNANTGPLSQQQPVRMRDVVYEMEVTLEELCHGGEKVVRIWSEVPVEGAGGRRERVSRDIEIGLTPGMTTVRVRAD